VAQRDRHLSPRRARRGSRAGGRCLTLATWRGRFLARAADDEEAARALLDVPRVSDAVVGFHAQQAVEKALKAVLVLNGIEYRFTHDLAYLLELCKTAGASIPRELQEVDRLSAFAVWLRHEDASATPVRRSQALAWASGAVRWAGEQIQSH
jgi:HEPN domain-containing protein